jgi:hypothetical protein
MSTSEQTQAQESFLSLLSPNLSTDTKTFLDAYRLGIRNSLPHNRVPSLKRFVVKSITGNKLGTSAQHEYLSIAVVDEWTSKSYTFYIERNSSTDSSHDSQVKMGAAVTASGLVSTASVAASIHASAAAASSSSNKGKEGVATDDLELPLLPLSRSSESLSLPALPGYPGSPSSESLCPPPLPRPISRKPSFTDQIGLALLQGVNSSSSNSGSSGFAEDRISGSAKFTIGQAFGLVVRQIEPIGLSLFELGILVDVIHDEAPYYKLLKNQCYWFSLVILEVVLMSYANSLDTQAGRSPDEYLPQQSGKWSNLLIAFPDKGLLERVKATFLDRRHREFSKVLQAVELVLIYIYLTCTV